MLHNKFMAGKKATVPESIHKSKTLTFDENGNLKEELSKDAEKELLSMDGYEKGKNEEILKPKDETETVSDEVKVLKAKLAKRDEDLKDESEKLAEVTKNFEAKVADLESELAKVNKEFEALKAKKK